MILAIDEYGDFRPNSAKYNFYVCVHIRQDEELYQIKKEQFNDWETSISSIYKNHQGEIKSSKLPNQVLHDFLLKVIVKEPIIGITPVCIVTQLNPESVVAKHKNLHLAGINHGVLGYLKIGKKRHANMYSQFANWYRKINYTQFVKIYLLGKCMYDALKNAIGHSISGGYDEELVNLKYKIDRIFLKGLEQNSFWHELIRNQHFSFSTTDPLPCLMDWRDSNHPFYKKYHSDDHYNMNELFWKNTDFVKSHEHFEVRISDAVCTILNRYWNGSELKKSYDIIKYAFNAKGQIECIALNDFDFEYRIGQLGQNP